MSSFIIFGIGLLLGVIIGFIGGIVMLCLSDKPEPPRSSSPWMWPR